MYFNEDRIKDIRKTTFRLIIILSYFIVFGCFTVPKTQPLYSNDTSPIEGIAKVHIYRPSTLWAGSAPVQVFENGESLPDLLNGSYYSFYRLPGKYEYKFKIALGYSRPFSITFLGGKEYFYKFDNRAFTMKNLFILVYPAIAKKEIAACRLAVNAVPISEQPIPSPTQPIKSTETEIVNSSITDKKPASKETESTSAKVAQPVKTTTPIGRQPIVSVLDFKVEGISVAESTLIIDMLSNAIVKTKQFIVLDRSQRQKILQEIEFSYSECSDESCQLKIGKLLAADNIVIGSIGKVGARFVVNIRMLEVETSRTVGTASEVYKSLEDLVDNCQTIASKLIE